MVNLPHVRCQGAGGAWAAVGASRWQSVRCPRASRPGSERGRESGVVARSRQPQFWTL